MGMHQRGARTAWARGRRRWGLGGLAVLTGAAALTIGAASAAPPAFPDNIVVFPDRDFVSAEGFQDRIGEDALVEVTRPGVGVVGSTRVQIAEGDLPFEINHPGGVCWGNGTDLQVTPDIRPGDIVSIDFASGSDPDATTQDGYVTSIEYTNGSDTLRVIGHIGAGIDPANVEQRIVNPDLRDTAVGRRDIRALPGPLTPDDSGAYQSGLEITGETFTATYVFLDADIAQMAATGGGARFMSWQETDADANRQGLTIAEFGEFGGPGMGGCPNGPLQSGPRGPSDVTAANVTAGGGPAIRVDWTPATAIPGTPAITGYRVHAVERNPKGAVQVEIGRRLTGQSVRSTTITGLSPDEVYDVFITSVSSVGETFPAVHAIPATDIDPPAVQASPGSGTFASAQTVTLSADEANSQLYYTLDGTDPLIGPDALAPEAIAYTGPFTVATTTTVKAVAFDPSGNVSATLEQTYTIDAGAIVPGAPTIGATSVGVGSVTLAWSVDPAYVITDYAVSVNDAGGTPRTDLPENPIVTTGTSLTVTGLTEGEPYYFTVTARNGNGPGPASAQVGPLRPLGELVADAGPDRTVTRGLTAQTVTLDGSASTPGATYAWEQIGASAADTVALTGATTTQPSFSLPLYLYPATNGPRTFRLTVTSPSGAVRTDDVVINVLKGDTVAVTSARWKVGDFRLGGTGTVDGATIRMHSGSLAGPVLGTAQVTLGAWTLRLRNGAAPATRPTSVWIESTVGGTAGPATVN